MFRTLASSNIDANHDYGYIQVFIDYLKQIIEILKDLFSSLGGKKEDGFFLHFCTERKQIMLR